MTRSANRSGFTLIEVMIAIGIFAVGAAMVATTFPAAVLENRDSSEHMLGALIAENALAICRNSLQHEEISGQTWYHMNIGTQFDAVESGRVSNWITPSEQLYPIRQGEDSAFFWIVAGRHMKGTENDYQLAIVVCRKFRPDEDPRDTVFTDVTISGENINVGGVQGAPVIMSQTGQVAKVLGSGKLNTNKLNGPAITVQNTNGSRSKAFYCLVARTSLKHHKY